MSVTEQPFGQTADGTKETLLTCTNASGNQMKLTSYGARIVAVTVPDKAGRLANVTLGFDTLAPYLTHKCFLGTTTGRFANRIAKGKFTLDGKSYQLLVNNGPNALHGGLKGFDKQHWDFKPFTTADASGVEFTLHSPDGDQGYPGAMDVQVKYTWSNDNALSIDYTATTDKPTILNLTNHAYWNLSGRGSILDDTLQLAANKYLPTDDTSIPLGDPEPVKGTIWDFTTPHVIGDRMDALKKPPHTTKGYDHCYVLRGPAGTLALAARVEDPHSGRTMDVLTTEPGVQLYCGNFLEGDEASGGFNQYEGFCLETQHFPDSPNHPDYPTVVLRPGQTYRQTTVHRFGVK
ncbi:MAG TPA: aldose epimerase family protein [Pirellulales bacterium]|nr:aldose epimerase family protein [Pirellulales bacterium]